MNNSNAPTTAVSHIIKAFDGIQSSDDTKSWLVTLRNQEDMDSVAKLISMLNGWKATDHPHILHMIQIFGEAND